VPLWWGLLPPPPRILRGIFWCGYRDAAAWARSTPPSAFDPCGCRRPPERGSQTAKEREGDRDRVRWEAVRALLKVDPSGDLPTLDPVTGENVAELITLAETLADRESRVAARALSAVVMVVVPLVMAVVVPLMQWPG